VRDRITHLERELAAFSRHRDQRRAQRVRHMVPIVSIVGYTNAGKSTLLNALTHSDVPVQDRPFETLDTSSRRLRVPHDREVIITDTVGFIRDLPKDLMGAFRTTLEELRDADLLLHVADASSRDLEGQIEAVESILSELDLDRIPRMLALNKSDRLNAGEIEVLARRYHAIAISALQRETLPPLVDCLARSLTETARISSASHGESRHACPKVE
jgi:GTP-binding protein HflX